MDKFESMRAFAQVVEAGGFAAAARQMGLSRSAVNKLVMNLEDHLQTQLLHRTTRKVSTTDAGRAFYQRCIRLLADLEEAELALTRMQEEPKGSLRINAPMTFGTLHLGPILTDFMAQYPDLKIELALSDRFIDPVDEGFDVTVRIAQVPISANLIVHFLAPSPVVLSAAPTYLERHGLPTQPEELKSHPCLHYGHIAQDNSWTLIGPDQDEYQIPIQGPLCCNNGEVLREAALAGLGIAMLPTFIVGEDLRQRRLQQVLPLYHPPEIGIYGLYPVNRHLSAKVTVLIDFLQGRLGRLAAPWPTHRPIGAVGA
ncbi:MAG: LysR family transcriptional regulator [Leptolyngbyaceae cyanobacterium SM2_3_12]|nr:LysR family transcriptional regulator [Leptolyngbyaceae cyanobacterium SM2_3_12]